MRRVLGSMIAAVTALGVTAILLVVGAQAQTAAPPPPPPPPPAQAAAQSSQGAALPMSQDELMAYARLEVAIGLARDSVQAELAMVGNKKTEVQEALREKLRKEIEELLHHGGMSQQEYERKTFMVSSNQSLRTAFDSLVVQLTGAPIPGQVRPGAQGQQGRGGRGGGAAAQVEVPAGPVGTHVGHVMNGFGDTPGGAGLLRTAEAEARIAAQHAGLAGRNPADLAGMKTHSGHVIHALDPTQEASGPGQGYGVKKAATGVAAHIELAANAEGASAGVKTHSGHVATAARSTVKRADQIIALAKQVQAATDAAAAAALVSQMASLCEQLIPGADANGDGRITWEDGEGGLQQAEEHVMLLLRG